MKGFYRSKYFLFFGEEKYGVVIQFEVYIYLFMFFLYKCFKDFKRFEIINIREIFKIC